MPGILSEEIEPCLPDAGIKTRSGEIACDEAGEAEQIGRKAKTCRCAAPGDVVDVLATRHTVGKGQFA